MPDDPEYWLPWWWDEPVNIPIEPVQMEPPQIGLANQTLNIDTPAAATDRFGGGPPPAAAAVAVSEEELAAIRRIKQQKELQKGMMHR